MGVLNLFKVPVPKQTNKIKTIGDIYTTISQDFAEIKGQTIGVDALNMVFMCVNSPIYLSDSSGRYTSHINNLINKLVKMSNKQIWVFDNKIKVESKSETIKKRTAYRGDTFEHISIGDAIREFKEVLDLLEIPYVTSPPKVEAEFYLCELKRNGVIDLIFSKDTDILAKGFDLMYYSFLSKEFRLYNIEKIRDTLGLSQDVFLKLCCMLGTDFNSKTFGISHLKMLDNLHLPLTKEQSVTFNMFKIYHRLHYENNIEIIKKFKATDNPNFKNPELIKFLEEREFKKLVTRLESI